MNYKNLYKSKYLCLLNHLNLGITKCQITENIEMFLLEETHVDTGPTLGCPTQGLNPGLLEATVLTTLLSHTLLHIE